MTKRVPLTRAQHAEFNAQGLLRLPAFFDRSDIDAMADAVWRDLGQRLGFARDRPETWTRTRPAQFQRLRKSGAFRRMDTPALRALGDELMGPGGWTAPKHWGLPLVTMPPSASDFDHAAWHFDLPGGDYRRSLAGLRLFTFLETVAPHGGGTLVVAGSHRLALGVADTLGPIPSAAMRTRLAERHAWFASLVAESSEAVRGRMGQPADIDGVTVTLREMTGEPGDLVVMHPLMLHGLAHNAANRPRMMLTESLWRR